MNVNRVLIGPLRIAGPGEDGKPPSVIDEQAGFAPPSWWRGDLYASRSGMAAAISMRSPR